MYVRHAISYFKNRAGIARALGKYRHRSAVYQWRPEGLVPLAAALILARESKGLLKVNPELYERMKDHRAKVLEKQRDDARYRRMLANLRPKRATPP